MRVEFAQIVDPIFEFALEQIAQIERGLEIDPVSMHAQLLNLFDRGDQCEGTSRKWQLAKYALAAWIDELLLDTPWDGVQWWRDHILEMELFRSRLCSVRFFELAQQASALSERDALEVFVNCVQLGFRGMYGQCEQSPHPAVDESADDMAPEPPHTLPSHTAPDQPPTLRDWVKQMEGRLDIHGYRRRSLAIGAELPQRFIQGAPPLPARQQVVWWGLTVVILALANLWAFQGPHFPLTK